MTWVGLKASRTHLIKARVLDVGLVPTVTSRRGRWCLLFLSGRSWIIRSCHTPCFLWVMDVKWPNTTPWTTKGYISFAKFLTELFMQIHPSRPPWGLDQCNQQVPHAGKQRHLLRPKYCTSLLWDFHPHSLGGARLSRVAFWKAHYSKWKDRFAKTETPKETEILHISVKNQQTEEPQMEGKKEGMVSEGKTEPQTQAFPTETWLVCTPGEWGIGPTV